MGVSRRSQIRAVQMYYCTVLYGSTYEGGDCWFCRVSFLLVDGGARENRDKGLKQSGRTELQLVLVGVVLCCVVLCCVGYEEKKQAAE